MTQPNVRRKSTACSSRVRPTIIGVAMLIIVHHIGSSKTRPPVTTTTVGQSVQIGTSLPVSDASSEPRSIEQSSFDPLEPILSQQVKVQAEFQQLIYNNQHPSDCKERRILLTNERLGNLDGFTLELQTLGRYLQAGVSQDRTFVLRDDWRSAYTPTECTRERVWECLYKPFSSCSQESVLKPGTNLTDASFERVNSTLASGVGIQPGFSDEGAKYFSTEHYGDGRVRTLGPFFFHQKQGYFDSVETYERAFGRFWVRAQMVHYLWKPSDELAEQIQARLPEMISKSSKTKPFIGMHIRYSDNIKTFAGKKGFGRDAHETRQLSRFMGIAESIRQESLVPIDTIFVATDSTKVMDQLSSYEDKWNIVVQSNVTRTDSEGWLWFKDLRSNAAGGIATDVEVLRRADYLIGSFQSNVYRLVTELNTAYNVGKYPIYQNRHRTVDIEWYEDP